jgi:predicted DNA-binding WGR domain protein
MKQWGCIGASGQVKAERYESADLAAAALARQAARKQRRGYREL